MTRKTKRLTVFMAFAAIGLVFIVLYSDGFRFPPPQFEPSPVKLSASHPVSKYRVTAKGAFHLPTKKEDDLYFRAFTPEPRLIIESPLTGEYVIRIENVHPKAYLPSGTTVISEKVTGLVRTVHGRTEPRAPVHLQWRFPTPNAYRFSIIGDTGGGTELKWALERSAQLQVDFVLHLGDIYYVPGDFARAVKLINASSVPVYMAVGNHEFSDRGRSVHEFFMNHIGPRNSTFELGGVRFVNLDTAAIVFPWFMGTRGRLIRDLPSIDANTTGFREYVVFTHKPLSDPPPTETEQFDHALGGLEAYWLRTQLLKRGARILLAGHLHISREFDDHGLTTYLSGQGLAHADLIVDRPVARILIGEVKPGRPVGYHWENLNMPFTAHCSERAWEVLRVLRKSDILTRLRDNCR